MQDVKLELKEFIKNKEKGCDFVYAECKKIIYKYQKEGKYRSEKEYQELINFICEELEY